MSVNYPELWRPQATDYSSRTLSTSQVMEYPDGLWHDQTLGSVTFPTSLSGLMTVAPSQLSHCANELRFPSDGRLDRTNNVSLSPHSRPAFTDTQPRRTAAAAAPASNRVQKVTVWSKRCRSKDSSKLRLRGETYSPWPRHILVRAKTLSNEITTDLLYYMVVLQSADVQACGTAICHKLGIHSVGYKSMRWTDKVSYSEGMVDTMFLSGLSEMQDFVVDVVGVGDDGYLELLLAM